MVSTVDDEAYKLSGKKALKQFTNSDNSSHVGGDSITVESSVTGFSMPLILQDELLRINSGRQQLISNTARLDSRLSRQRNAGIEIHR